MTEACFRSAEELRRCIQTRELSVRALTELYLERIRRYDGKLCAVAELAPDAAEQASRMDAAEDGRDLPLFGLPILVKDNIDVAGLHTTAGSPVLREHVARADAPVVANLRKAGALILGKTNMTEFAHYTAKHMPPGFSFRGGRVKNAYDLAKDPGGSSTGSAVALSAGFCAAAVGTDTAFSVVGCATENGVTGLKPPHGALDGGGIVPIAHSLDSAGPMTRTLNDALLLYGAMRGTPLPPLTPAPYGALRVAVNTAQRDQVSQAQSARYARLFRALEERGTVFGEVEQPDVPELDDIMRCEFRHDLERYLAQSGAPVRSLAEIVEAYEANPAWMPYGVSYLRDALDNASGKLDDPAYLAALYKRARLEPAVRAALAEYDACVMTGSSGVMHFCGLPSLALKLCPDEDGCPRGIILYGADELRLYRAALAIERLCLPIPPPKLS